MHESRFMPHAVVTRGVTQLCMVALKVKYLIQNNIITQYLLQALDTSFLYRYIQLL